MIYLARDCMSTTISGLPGGWKWTFQSERAPLYHNWPPGMGSLYTAAQGSSRMACVLREICSAQHLQSFTSAAERAAWLSEIEASCGKKKDGQSSCQLLKAFLQQ